MTDDIKRTATAIADAHGLPPELVLAIIQVESGGDTWACRYEPAYQGRYLDGKKDSHFKLRPKTCTVHTERYMRACSWGLMQVMGENARAFGHVGWLTELCSQEVGISIGCKMLSMLAKAYNGTPSMWESVCSAYNGGKGAVKAPGDYRNPEYVAKVLKALGGEWPA